MINVSVLVLTYKPQTNLLLYTLASIINQKNISFEIIISDDGSDSFPQNEVKDFFISHNFENYQITLLKENGGTVKNANNGLPLLKGEYVKCISPGDYLYDDNTLHDFYLYAKENKSDVVFGNSVHFNIVNNNINTFPSIDRPRYLKPYIKKSVKLQKKYYLFLADFITGVSFFTKRVVLSQYLPLINNHVKYADDSVYIIMSGVGIRFDYYNRNICWYEYGTGVSTNNNSIWEERLFNDVKAALEILVSIKPECKIYLDLHIKKKTIKVIFLRLIRKFYHLRKTNRNNVFDIDNLKKIINYQ